MNRLHTFLAVLLSAICATCSADELTATNCSQMIAISLNYKSSETRFDVTAHILPRASTAKDRFSLVSDGTGAMAIHFDELSPKVELKPGDLAHITGTIKYDPADVYFIGRTCEVISSGHAEEIPTVTATELLSGALDFRPVRVRGLVHNICVDENNPDFMYLILLCDKDFLYCASRRNGSATEITERYLGAEVEVQGDCQPYIHSNRRQLGRVIQCGSDANIRILSQARGNPFEVPEINDLRAEHPSRLPLAGRRRVTGRVEAIWGDRHVLVRPVNGYVSNLELSDASELPRIGEYIEASGFPETDLYRVNLTQAIWRPSAVDIPSAPAPQALTARQLLGSGQEHLNIDPTLHGSRVTLEGVVHALSNEDNGNPHFNLESEGCLIPIIAAPGVSLSQKLTDDCRVRLTGVAIMDVETWRPSLAFPRMQGASLALITPQDVEILARPSWWTPARLTVLILALVVLLLAVAAWSLLLNHLANRRGRDLAAEQVAHVASELKVMERTRLAVELHDSIAQNLTGIALELQTVGELMKDAPEAAREHLTIADTSLRSSREELRNCLRDLRSEALEVSDMNKAIRMTLGAQTGKTDVAIRFNIPRERLSDNTTHTLLRIIRELVLNAIRHGEATEVKVAGVCENGQIRFSVADNGKGFDVDNHPGVREGHFGLQGIRERIAALDGNVEIVSHLGSGTRVSVTLNLPQVNS